MIFEPPQYFRDKQVFFNTLSEFQGDTKLARFINPEEDRTINRASTAKKMEIWWDDTLAPKYLATQQEHKRSAFIKDDLKLVFPLWKPILKHNSPAKLTQ